jgi:hypothetical protein
MVLTNPRNKPQTVTKWKWNTWSEELSSSARHWADSPRWPGRRFAWYGRTVRGSRTNGPKKENQTSNSAPQITDGPRLVLRRSMSNWCRADDPRRPGRLSAKLLPARNCWWNGSKWKNSRTREEHEEHLDELHLADSPPATRGQSARHGYSSPSLKPQEPNHLPVHGSPKRLKLLRKDLGPLKRP